MDLVADGIEPLSAGTICADTSPTFRAYLANEGSDPSNDFAIRWVVDGVEVFDGGHGDIPGGGTDTHDHIWQNMTAGPHELRFIVDPEDQIAEVKETNNESVLTFTAEPCIG